MRITESFGKISWVDLHKPSEAEVADLVKDFKISNLVSEELRERSVRPKVDRYKDYIYLILQFPIYQHEEGARDNFEVDFIVGKDFVITCHYHDSELIESIRAKSGFGGFVGADTKVTHGGLLMYAIIRHLYESIERNVEELNDNLVEVEESIFMGREREMVPIIATVNHDILDFKRSLKRHSGVLESLGREAEGFFPANFDHYIQDLRGEYTKVWNMVEDSKETLDDLRTTNDSLLTTKQNETMRVLTVIAFITLPLTLLAGIFGMNTVHMPIVGLRTDFWVVILLMLLASLSMIAIFKYKKWF